MKIPRYWTSARVDGQGQPVEGPGPEADTFSACGWSDVSEADALEQAIERARRVAAHFGPHRRGTGRSAGEEPRDWYAYGDRPVREPIVDRDDDAGWIITRNAYGALVLNTDRAMFIDIDVPRSGRPGRGGLLGSLFGGRSKQPATPAPDVTVRGRIAEVVTTLDGMSVRLYRTAAGFRGVVTSETCDPNTDLARQTMEAFGADPAYVRLCALQESFRARLTPKPWRCRGLAAPEDRFPFGGDAAARRFARWLERYERAVPDYAVCTLAEDLGPGHVAPAIRPIVDLHDRHVLREGRLLA